MEMTSRYIFGRYETAEDESMRKANKDKRAEAKLKTLELRDKGKKRKK